MALDISVVVPTYNRAKLIKNCIGSLANQRFNPLCYEIIVVSDGPDDNTVAVIEEYIGKGHTNIRYFCLPKRKGPAGARNLGWQNARGSLIAFTDDDCLPDSEWLNNIRSSYNNEVEIAFTGKMIVPVSANPTDFELNTKGLERGRFVTANCAVTKAALQATGGFDEEFTTAWREDSDLEFKLLQRGVRIVRLDNAKVVHPVREAHWGVSIKEQRKTMFNALLFKKYPDLYRRYIKPKPSIRYYAIISLFLMGLIFLLMKLQLPTLIAFLSWLGLTAEFAYERLAATRKTKEHVLEMIATSLVIPFLSVYWTLYGAVKYRVLFF